MLVFAPCRTNSQKRIGRDCPPRDRKDEPAALCGRALDTATVVRGFLNRAEKMSTDKIASEQIGRRGFLQRSGKLAAGISLAGSVAVSQTSKPLSSAAKADTQDNCMRVWSDQPAFTRLLENEREQSAITTDVFDGVWAGDPVPHLPRVPRPSPVVKRWHTGEGTDYLDEETAAATKGKYPNPVRTWEAEPYPIGNGRIAASVFHGSGRDRYALDEVSFWSGGRNLGTINDKGDKRYDGENGPDVGDNGFGGYQPVGDLIIDFNAPVQKGTFVREISLDKGVVRSVGVRKGITVESTAFCSHPVQVMVLHYQAAEQKTFDATLSVARQRATDSVSVGAQEIRLASELKNGMRCRATAVIVSHGGEQTAAPGHMILKAVHSFMVVIAIETNYLMDDRKNWRGEEPEGKIAERLNKVRGQSFDELFRTHCVDYQSLFDRVRLKLGQSSDSRQDMPTPKRLEAYRQDPNDPGLEEVLFNFGRYLMISTSRPGSLPAGLQGIWNGMIAAPWGNDYHSDINFQMVYWLPEPANLSECHLSMIDYLWATREPNKVATREYLEATGQSKEPRSAGWLVYISQNPFGGNGWQMNLPGSAWYALHMWEHFAFTQDFEYLRNEAYPMMKELSEYWESHLKVLGDGAAGFESDYRPLDVSLYPELAHVKAGTLVVPNGWSPEHGPRGEDGVAMDQEIISELFLNTIKASEILNVDQEWATQLKVKRDSMLPPQIGRRGNLMEWMIDRDPVTDHRHTSHLFAVFPGSTITVERTPELAEAARKSLLWRKTTGDSRRSWAWTWRCMLWARLRDGDRAHQMLEGLITYNMLDNLFTTHHIPLQIDGNYGIAAAMLEMLVQSQSDVIELLPAPSSRWPQGRVRGAKARGNILVDMSWKDGKVTTWTLSSPEPKRVTVLVNGSRIEVVPTAVPLNTGGLNQDRPEPAASV
jgi:alpha-L-fucosidase 2